MLVSRVAAEIGLPQRVSEVMKRWIGENKLVVKQISRDKAGNLWVKADQETLKQIKDHFIGLRAA